MPEPTEAGKQISQNEPELLLEVEHPGYRLRLQLEHKQMECRADLEFFETSTEPAEDTNIPPAQFLYASALTLLLQQYGVTKTIDFEAFYKFCAAAAEGVAQKRVLLAKGIEPVPGADGWFEMAVKSQEDKPVYEEDARGNVDLRTLHQHTEAEVAQKLGTVHPPKEGMPGITAHGLPIPAERGKPFPLIAGDGVILKYDNRIAFAEKAGRVLLDRQTLSVVDELIVPGDLDLKVGNIDFHGFVEIRGDVPDDFTLRATKGMKISGNVGACRLEAGGSIEIGSMSGRERGQILCHGDLKANYLNQAQVSCYGNVLISLEIRNSQIKATGYIMVERGSIIGGKCLALEGIEARILGAASGVRTHIVSGRYFPDTDRFDLLHQRLKEIETQLQSIHRALGPLQEFRRQSSVLEKASEFRLLILNKQWEKLEQEKEQLVTELTTSNSQSFSRTNPKINALKTIKEGVVVCLGKSSESFSTDLAGPLTLVENTKDGGLRHLKLSPLSHQASRIEAEILQHELPKEATFS